MLRQCRVSPSINLTAVRVNRLMCVESFTRRRALANADTFIAVLQLEMRVRLICAISFYLPRLTYLRGVQCIV